MKLIVLLFLLALIILSWVFDPVFLIFDKSKKSFSYKKDAELVNWSKNNNLNPTLSVVIPAYNEENRIVSMLNSALNYLNTNDLDYELIVVDDGSSDLTISVLNQFVKENNLENIKLLKLKRNLGKGGAVKYGVDLSRGKYILMADADGATDFSDFKKLFDSLKQTEKKFSFANETHGITVGSRAHLEKESMAKRQFYRTILMKGFHMFVSTLCTQKIKDTQCGFKLFTKDSAKRVFSNLHLYRWAFDIEVIYIAEAMQYPISEVSVNWHEVPGSKLIQKKIDVVLTSLTMARDIICLRLAYLLGFWQLPIVENKPLNKNSEL